MIREFLIGGVLVGGGGYYVASNYTSADVVRTVKATPHDTWRGFNLILNDYSAGMAEMSMAEVSMGEGPGGERREFKPVVTSIPGKEIDFRLMKQQAEIVRIHVTFEPLAGGRETKLSLDAHVANEALPDGRPVFGGNILFRQVLAGMTEKVAAEIESGKLVKVADAFAEMRHRIAADPRIGEAKMRMQERARRDAQEAASKPQLDPNAARLNPQGATIVPMDPTPRN
ncbi:hypothetical protein [Sphingomonas sp.]|jgi:hypothetical protein|uniref:hypothetical protein n=1 Tax=Sphingomonas sp. TaxID=28214 RepID=UPI002ED95742